MLYRIVHQLVQGKVQPNQLAQVLSVSGGEAYIAFMVFERFFEISTPASAITFTASGLSPCLIIPAE
jgi:hypothetical protein